MHGGRGGGDGERKTEKERSLEVISMQKKDSVQ